MGAVAPHSHGGPYGSESVATARKAHAMAGNTDVPCTSPVPRLKAARTAIPSCHQCGRPNTTPAQPSTPSWGPTGAISCLSCFRRLIADSSAFRAKRARKYTQNASSHRRHHCTMPRANSEGLRPPKRPPTQCFRLANVAESWHNLGLHTVVTACSSDTSWASVWYNMARRLGTGHNSASTESEHRRGTPAHVPKRGSA